MNPLPTYLLIRLNKIKFFPSNTKNTDRNGLNKQNTHKKKQTLREIILERVSMKISDPFLKNNSPIYRTLLFYGKNLTPAPTLFC